MPIHSCQDLVDLFRCRRRYVLQFTTEETTAVLKQWFGFNAQQSWSAELSCWHNIRRVFYFSLFFFSWSVNAQDKLGWVVVLRSVPWKVAVAWSTAQQRSQPYLCQVNRHHCLMYPHLCAQRPIQTQHTETSWSLLCFLDGDKCLFFLSLPQLSLRGCVLHATPKYKIHTAAAKRNPQNFKMFKLILISECFSFMVWKSSNERRFFSAPSIHARVTMIKTSSAEKKCPLTNDEETFWKMSLNMQRLGN